jgi:hypothetical protein
MKFSKSLVASAILLATSTATFAATDSGTININVTQSEFVALTGTAFDNTAAAPATFTTTALDASFGGAGLSLGTVGLNSNLLGNCNIQFSSTNSFSLKDGTTTLVGYGLTYDSTAVVAATDITKSCQFTAAALTLNSSAALPAANTIAAGTYSDVISVIVTSI